MTPLKLRLAAMLFAVWGTACQPEIGDPCHTAADCTTGTDRICDATQPGGYCTVFNCEPSGCPEEGACVAFREAPSATAECSSVQEAARLQRTFCMRRCYDDRDCRDGYACLDLQNLPPEENPWSAIVIEPERVAVCVWPYSGPLPEDERQTEVCTAGPSVSDAGADPDGGG